MAKREAMRPGRRLYLLKVANVSARRLVRERTLEDDEQSRFERTKRNRSEALHQGIRTWVVPARLSLRVAVNGREASRGQPKC
jgi:hypothetical protein